jgi:hypothetical protein
VVEISPVLLFEKDEYQNHGESVYLIKPLRSQSFQGKYTALDHYTFIWPNGRMALALGLGDYLWLKPSRQPFSDL